MQIFFEKDILNARKESFANGKSQNIRHLGFKAYLNTG